MGDLAELDQAEVDELELVVLGDDQVERAQVVVYQFLVLRQLFYHVDGLQKDVEQLFISVEQLLALAL